MMRFVSNAVAKKRHNVRLEPLDFAVRKAFGELVGLEKPPLQLMRERAEAWRPYRTVVAWYLWRSLTLPGVEKIVERNFKTK